MNLKLKITDAVMSTSQLIVTIESEGKKYTCVCGYLPTPLFPSEKLDLRTALMLLHVIEDIALETGASIEDIEKAVKLYLG